MTETSAPPTAPADLDYPRPPAVGGVLVGGAVAGAGGIACAALAVLGWFGSDAGSHAAAMRLGLGVWLLGHGTPVDLGGTTVALIPLGLTLVAVALLAGGTRWVVGTSAVRRLRDGAAAVAALTGVYGVGGVLLGLLARSDGVQPHLVWAGVGSAAVAVAGGGLGLATSAELRGRVWRKLPTEIRAACCGGAAGVVALVTGGSALLSVALILRFEHAVDLTAALAPGVVGGTLLTLLALAYLPTAIVYATSFALGPGFAVGTGTAVAPTGVELGPLPAFPPLAALPETTPDAWVFGVLGVPLLAGIASGLAATWRYPLAAADMAALRGALAGVAGGVAFAGSTTLTTGAAGPGRLETMGPEPLEILLVATLTLALTGATSALVSTLLRRLRERRAEQRVATGTAT